MWDSAGGLRQRHEDALNEESKKAGKEILISCLPAFLITTLWIGNPLALLVVGRRRLLLRCFRGCFSGFRRAEFASFASFPN